MVDARRSPAEIAAQVATVVRPFWQRLHLDELEARFFFSPDELVAATVQATQSYLEERSDESEELDEAEIAGYLVYRIVSRRLWQGGQSSNEAEQNAVYQWLGEYCYRHIAPKAGAEVAEDLTNETLAKVFGKFATCRSPDFFLKWVTQIASREVGQYFRKNKKGQPRWDEDEPDVAKLREVLQVEPDDKLADWPDTAPTPEELVLTGERMLAIFERIHRWGRGKRARQYQTILYWTYFLGRPDADIAAQCGLSVADMQKMRSHALKVLRNDRDWLDSIR